MGIFVERNAPNEKCNEKCTKKRIFPFLLCEVSIDPVYCQGEGEHQGRLVQLQEVEAEPGPVIPGQELEQALLHDEGLHVDTGAHRHLSPNIHILICCQK